MNIQFVPFARHGVLIFRSWEKRRIWTWDTNPKGELTAGVCCFSCRKTASPHPPKCELNAFTQFPFRLNSPCVVILPGRYRNRHTSFSRSSSLQASLLIFIPHRGPRYDRALSGFFERSLSLCNISKLFSASSKLIGVKCTWSGLSRCFGYSI